jgi:hypothetical protein
VCDKSGSKERDKSIPKVSVSLLLHLIPLLLLPTYPFFMPNCCEYIPQNIVFYFLLLIVATYFTAMCLFGKTKACQGFNCFPYHWFLYYYFNLSSNPTPTIVSHLRRSFMNLVTSSCPFRIAIKHSSSYRSLSISMT